MGAVIVTGILDRVTQEPLGSSLSTDVMSGETVLHLDWTVEFPETGGLLEVGGTTYTYTAADRDESTVTLATPLVADITEGEGVWALSANGERRRAVFAWVQLDEDQEPVACQVATTLEGRVTPATPPGTVVTIDDDTRLVLSVGDVDTSLTFLTDEEFTVTPGGTTVSSPMPLPSGITIEAGIEAINVIWSGSASAAIPDHFARLAIHVSKITGFTPNAGTEVAAIGSPFGGVTTYNGADPETYYVRCAFVSLRGDTGDFTAEVAVTPSEGARLGVTRIENTTTQSIPDTSPTTVAFNTSRSGSAAVTADVANNRLVVASEGDYLVETLVIFSPDTAGYRELRILRNGVIATYLKVSPNANTPIPLMTVIRCSAGDRFTAVVVQNSGSSLPLNAGAFLQALRLSS